MSKYSLEPLMEVWNDQTGGSYQIGPFRGGRSGPNLLEIRKYTQTKKIIERMILSTKVANKIGRSLVNEQDEVIEADDISQFSDIELIHDDDGTAILSMTSGIQKSTNVSFEFDAEEAILIGKAINTLLDLYRFS